ncbi:MAG: ribonuclease P protein component [Bacteroidales bacterium]|nr:ribonuclease P protein component [Bacteroidales bacterium]
MDGRRIMAMMQEGRVSFHYPLKVLSAPGTGDFGVSVPKRYFKRAVKRNLLKRRMREAWRLHAPAGAAYDVFVQYIGKQLEDYGRIEKSMVAVIADLAAGQAD